MQKAHLNQARLSDQLYSTTTHLLLELLQNADDNAYDPSVTPTVKITFGQDDHFPFLLIRCNETGFDSANVEAICRIAHSTKKGAKFRNAGYIGEKGIGFKSVFRVASQVWITSNGYNFMLDRTERLGMVKPIWTAFPAQHQLDTQGTQMLLKLVESANDSNDILAVKREVGRLDSRLLVFLRKIKTLQLEVSDSAGGSWQRTESCSSITSHGGEAVTLCTRSGKSESSSIHLVQKATCTAMPAIVAREGLEQSEVVLSFPINNNGDPITQTCLAYAYLPIKSYGFLVCSEH